MGKANITPWVHFVYGATTRAKPFCKYTKGRRGFCGSSRYPQDVTCPDCRKIIKDNGIVVHFTLPVGDCHGACDHTGEYSSYKPADVTCFDCKQTWEYIEFRITQDTQKMQHKKGKQVEVI